MSAPGEIRPDACADSQPLLHSQSTTNHTMAVPLPCQNGERIKGTHGRDRTIGTSCNQYPQQVYANGTTS